MTIKLSSRENKQNRPRLLVFAIFFTCLPPWNTTFLSHNLKRVHRQWVSRGGARAWTKRRPDGLKKNFLSPPPPTPLIWRSGSATGILEWLDWIFVGDTSQVWALNASAWVKIWEKGYHDYLWRLKFLMIWVLLQSESPWQRNDAIALWREKNHFDEKWHAVVYCERVRFFA